MLLPVGRSTAMHHAPNLAHAPCRLKDWALSALSARPSPSIAGAPASPAALAPHGGGMHARMQDLVDAHHVPLLGSDKLKMG